MTVREAYNAAMRRRIAAAGVDPAAATSIPGDDVLAGRASVIGPNLPGGGPQTRRLVYGDLDVELGELDVTIELLVAGIRELIGKRAQPPEAAIREALDVAFLAGVLKGRAVGRAT